MHCQNACAQSGRPLSPLPRRDGFSQLGGGNRVNTLLAAAEMPLDAATSASRAPFADTPFSPFCRHAASINYLPPPRGGSDNHFRRYLQPLSTGYTITIKMILAGIPGNGCLIHLTISPLSSAVIPSYCAHNGFVIPDAKARFRHHG